MARLNFESLVSRPTVRNSAFAFWYSSRAQSAHSLVYIVTIQITFLETRPLFLLTTKAAQKL